MLIVSLINQKIIQIHIYYGEFLQTHLISLADPTESTHNSLTTNLLLVIYSSRHPRTAHTCHHLQSLTKKKYEK